MKGFTPIVASMEPDVPAYRTRRSLSDGHFLDHRCVDTNTICTDTNVSVSVYGDISKPIKLYRTNWLPTPRIIFYLYMTLCHIHLPQKKLEFMKSCTGLYRHVPSSGVLMGWAGPKKLSPWVIEPWPSPPMVFSQKSAQPMGVHGPYMLSKLFAYVV